MVFSEVPHSQACICCISIAPFTQICFAAAHTHAESVEGFPQLPLSSQIYGQVLVVHWLGIGSFAIVALQFVVPPTMLSLLLEEAVTVADCMNEVFS